MNRRQLLKTVGASSATISLAGCAGVLKSGGGLGGSDGKWGLPQCSNHPVKVRGATITESTYDSRHDSYRTKVNIVIEVLAAETQVVRIKGFRILDKDGNRVGSVNTWSDSLELTPGTTKTFSFVTKTGSEPSQIDKLTVQALPVDEWKAADLSEWQNSGNKGCS